MGKLAETSNSGPESFLKAHEKIQAKTTYAFSSI